jgi:hypothetical protein
MCGMTHRTKLTRDSAPARLASLKPTSFIIIIHQELRACSMTCAPAVGYQSAVPFPLPEQSTRFPVSGYLPFIDQTLLGYILVPSWCNLPSTKPTSRMLFCFFAAPQCDFMLHAADRGSRQEEENPEARGLTSEQRCRREMSPAFVTATTTLLYPIWAFALLATGRGSPFSCRPRPAVERLGLITTCHPPHHIRHRVHECVHEGIWLSLRGP